MQRRVKVSRLRVLNMFIAANQVTDVSRDRSVIPVAHRKERVQKQAARHTNTNTDWFVLVALLSVGNFVFKRFTFSSPNFPWHHKREKYLGLQSVANIFKRSPIISGFILRADEKLTVFVQLEKATNCSTLSSIL